MCRRALGNLSRKSATQPELVLRPKCFFPLYLCRPILSHYYGIMMETREPVRSEVVSWFCIVAGSYSVAVPLIATPIALVRLASATHGHPVFGGALCFYLSSLITGAMSLIVVWKIRRYAMLWLPLVGVTFS